MEASGILALFAAIVVSRLLNERGLRRLTAEEKVRLVDGFSGSRAYSMIPLFVLLAGFFLLSNQAWVDRSTLWIGYFAVLTVYVLGMAWFNQRRLRSLQMPAEYIRTFTISQVVSLLGVAWLFFTLTYAGQFN